MRVPCSVTRPSLLESGPAAGIAAGVPRAEGTACRRRDAFGRRKHDLANLFGLATWGRLSKPVPNISPSFTIPRREQQLLEMFQEISE